MEQQLKKPLDFVSQQILISMMQDYFKYGFIAPSYTTAIRDQLPAKAGQIIFNSTTSKLNFYTGSAWQAVTSS